MVHLAFKEIGHLTAEEGELTSVRRQFVGLWSEDFPVSVGCGLLGPWPELPTQGLAAL